MTVLMLCARAVPLLLLLIFAFATLTCASISVSFNTFSDPNCTVPYYISLPLLTQSLGTTCLPSSTPASSLLVSSSYPTCTLSTSPSTPTAPLTVQFYDPAVPPPANVGLPSCSSTPVSASMDVEYVNASVATCLSATLTLVEGETSPLSTNIAVPLFATLFCTSLPSPSTSSSPPSFTSSSASTAALPVSRSTAGTAAPPSPATGSICFLQYSQQGNVDYPWSTATSLTFTYDPTLITTASGTAVNLLSGTGRRTFSNRFGETFTSALTLRTSDIASLLYLNSSTPVDETGLMWTLDSPVQLPGAGPLSSTSLLRIYSSHGAVVEANSSLIDPQGIAFLSTVPSFLNLSIRPSNVNSLAVQYASCLAPISFTNGLREPTQPTTFNGAEHVLYSYSISDGVTYTVQANLSITTSSAFATTQDQLGNPYQTVINMTGTRLYTFLPTGQQLLSLVTGLSSPDENAAVSQRFYPYSLLDSAPGVYSETIAPWLDAAGISFDVQPAAPTLGLPLDQVGGNSQPLQDRIRVLLTSTSDSSHVVMTEAQYLTLPLLSLQQQQYSLAT